MISLGGAGHKMWQRLTNVEQRFDNYYMLDASECNSEIYDLSAFDGPANELVRFHLGSFETCMQQYFDWVCACVVRPNANQGCDES
jgi:hypothetical protein